MQNLMKSTFLLALALLFSLPAFAQTAEESIKKVCLAETQAWLDIDFETWVAQHAQHENETLVWTNPDGSFGSLVGWPIIYKTIKEGAANAKKDPAKLSHENYAFIVQGSMAFAAYDQILTAPDGKISKSREHRNLILKDGQWKIVAVMAFYDHAGAKK